LEKPSLFKRFKDWCLMQIGIGAFLLFRSTMRFRVVNPEYREAAKKVGPNGSHIVAIWHENSFSSVSGHAHQGLTPMISLSKDGEAIARVCKAIGYKTPVRGSSSKGGSTVKKLMVEELLNGGVAAITVDGPRGPRREVKYGVIKIASETGAPIVPNGCFSKRKWIFRSWDKFRLPKPFSEIQLIYGEPVYVPKDIDKEGIEKYAQILADRLNGCEIDKEPAT